MLLWPWDSLVRPIRTYFARRRRSRWKEKWDKGVCSSCKLHFDSGKKRRVLDSCGHHRCYSCLCTQDVCPLCSHEIRVYASHDNASVKIEKFESKNPNENLSQYTISRTLHLENSCKVNSIEIVEQGEQQKRDSRISSLGSEFSFDGSFPSIKKSSITLKPLYFEVPQTDGDNVILYRDWLIQEISKTIFSSSLRGVVLIGDEGAGKTSLVLQLVNWSTFGNKRKSVILNDASFCSMDVLEKLSSQLVAYHFCQADCKDTCSIPEFIHSLAAQLCQAPQLHEYKNLLLKNEQLQQILMLKSCVMDPDRAFRKGILESLLSLTTCPSIPNFLIIDSVDESNNGLRSITSFLTSYINQFPSWLKMILTVNTASVDVIEYLPLHRINLNCTEFKVRDDLLRYIRCRMIHSSCLKTNVSSCGDDSMILRFSEHLARNKEASFLFVKLILDLLQQNHLVIKSSSFNVIPVSLNEVFTLILSLKFPSTATLSKVKPVLEICLSSSNPLTALEIFYVLESASVVPSFSWTNYTQNLQSLSGILSQRKDDSLMISYPSLRRWLLRNQKLSLDPSTGHSYLALLYTRLTYQMTTEKELELVYHLTRSKVFPTDDSFKIVWLHQRIATPSAILTTPALAYWPDEQIFDLLLKAGADSNAGVGTNEQPILSLICKLGFVEIASLLLNNGADPDKGDIFGTTSLMESANQGHLNIIEILLAAGAKVHLLDKVGRCALCFAAKNGYLDIIQKLLDLKNWASSTLRSQAIKRAIIYAACVNNLQACEYLLSITQPTERNIRDSISLCFRDQQAISQFLSNNNSSMTNALFLSAASGSIPVLKIIADKKFPLNCKDENGRTALSWACVYGKTEVVQFCIEAKMDVNTKDSEGFTPLHLAALYADGAIVNLLQTQGAVIGVKNKENKTPLHCGICAENYSSVLALLKGGATIDATAFVYAESNPHFYALLLDKLLCDGVSLYNQKRFTEANHRFKYALEKACFRENLDQVLSRLQEGHQLCEYKIRMEKVEERS